MKSHLVYLPLLISIASACVNAAPQNNAPTTANNPTIQVSIQINEEQSPTLSTFNYRNQGQQFEWHLVTKTRLSNGSIKETPNGWSMIINKITLDKVSLSITFTEQEDSQTFLFEKTPQNTVQCQHFPFNKAIVQNPVVCITSITTD